MVISFPLPLQRIANALFWSGRLVARLRVTFTRMLEASTRSML